MICGPTVVCLLKNERNVSGQVSSGSHQVRLGAVRAVHGRVQSDRPAAAGGQPARCHARPAAAQTVLQGRPTHLPAAQDTRPRLAVCGG